MTGPRVRPADLRRLTARAHRCVEAQHVIGTRRLVDTVEEQELLEDLIEGQKPPVPPGPEFRGLHYLLKTSFRYPPLRHGSRFGTRAERSIWYGGETLRTAFAEAAYYRLVFLDGTRADLGALTFEWTTFELGIATPRGLDLTRPPYAGREARISSPVDYAYSQALGAAMRTAGVAAFRFRSARDRGRGCNIGVFDPAAFASRRPARMATWHCTADRRGVEVFRKTIARQERFVFRREEFEVAGRLPAPAL